MRIRIKQSEDCNGAICEEMKSNKENNMLKSTFFRKKPVVIEAVQWSGLWEDVPFIKTFTEGTAFERSDIDGKRSYLYIKTLEGEHLASPKDWIIKGVQGEFYLCKPDIFEATYEQVYPSPLNRMKAMSPTNEVV